MGRSPFTLFRTAKFRIFQRVSMFFLLTKNGRPNEREKGCFEKNKSFGMVQNCTFGVYQGQIETIPFTTMVICCSQGLHNQTNRQSQGFSARKKNSRLEGEKSQLSTHLNQKSGFRSRLALRKKMKNRMIRYFYGRTVKFLFCSS